MQKQIKILLTLLTALILAISCKNPNNPNNSNNQPTVPGTGTGTGGGTTTAIYYGNQTTEVDINDQAKLEELWLGLIANKIVYSTSAYNTVTGEFKADANYYETKYQSGASPRTVFKKCVIYKWNGKNYIAGVYWDNQTGIGMTIRYRLIIIDEKGVEHAWYGGGGDASVIPDENTAWVKYYFVFGYIQDY